MPALIGSTYGRVYGAVTVAANDPAKKLIYKQYTFSNPLLSWVVTHNLNTRNFTATLVDSDGDVFYASINIISNNQFIVLLTTPVAGIVNVLFNA